MVEQARPKKRRASVLNATLGEALLIYEPVFETVGGLIQLHWAWQHWIPTIDEEIAGTMRMVFCRSFETRHLNPLVFPPPPELLYARTRWALVKQYIPRNSIHRLGNLEPYETLEHWNPDKPENIVTRHDIIGGNSEDIYPWDFRPDILDMWYLGLTAKQIAVMHDKTARQILNIIHSFYDTIEEALSRIPEGHPRPQCPRVSRPSRGMPRRDSTYIMLTDSKLPTME